MKLSINFSDIHSRYAARIRKQDNKRVMWNWIIAAMAVCLVWLAGNLVYNSGPLPVGLVALGGIIFYILFRQTQVFMAIPPAIIQAEVNLFFLVNTDSLNQYYCSHLGDITRAWYRYDRSTEHNKTLWVEFSRRTDKMFIFEEEGLVVYRKDPQTGHLHSAMYSWPEKGFAPRDHY